MHGIRQTIRRPISEKLVVIGSPVIETCSQAPDADSELHRAFRSIGEP